MTKITINQSITIETTSSETLLESMEKAGLDVEYQCRDGHCGACRCQLASGNVEYTGFAMACTQGNEILPCICRSVQEDIALNQVKYQHKKVKRA
ncbi:3-ketosteroid-9-alpha-hydroxylase reductase subunit [Vibrio aerogenes CECT 7868]|uniref:3-ketosteroid-9-alpha-hydroxylase reductase subunit n=1 Tax=Vibrio aerogenes CECT 7868 TaxID=1216006 RepID=A0A1M6DYB9_9VIBR|nr:class I ribonucleotide reductase maintenance protein YfaE [Vibrio aerogenes]SHI78254.1 3-ketosteroid-9-alpha-hydroxylase reductase subunit [Vibrio aerogenes CECT 7868]